MAEFVRQAKLGSADFARIDDADATLEEGVLVPRVDLRPEGQCE